MKNSYKKLPESWVKRLFEVLSTIYEERWSNLYRNKKREDIYIDQWSTALSGLSPEEIKLGIYRCQCYPYGDIPNCIEFYHYAKGIKEPSSKKSTHISVSISPIANNHIKQIKDSLRSKSATSR